MSSTTCVASLIDARFRRPPGTDTARAVAGWRMTCPGSGSMVRLAEAGERLCNGYRTVGRPPATHLQLYWILPCILRGGYTLRVIRLIGSLNGRKAVNGYEGRRER